jgi:hypothetical protein
LEAISGSSPDSEEAEIVRAAARLCKMMGDSRETIEAAEGQRRCENAFRIAHNQLIDRQQGKIDCLREPAQGVTDLI